MAVTHSGGTARTRPDRKRAAPTPPASATTRGASGAIGCRRCRCHELAPRAQLLELRLELRQAVGCLAHGRLVDRIPASLRLGLADALRQADLGLRDLLLELADARVDRRDVLRPGRHGG